jgi:hypothetical protein
MTDKELNTTLDDVFKTTPAGSIDTAIGGVFYGINHRQQPSAIPINKDVYGLTFFTRPQLNLSPFNIAAERKFIPLTTSEPASIQRIIRCYLDPRLGYNIPGASDANRKLNSPFVDNQNAFISVLTNHLQSCTGWPDPVVETFTSKPGAYKEVYGFTDSNIDEFSSYDITATFRNMVGDPISLLFATWLRYQANVFQGIMSPYPDFIVKNEIDYNTRIYRLVLDKNKKYVQKIACTGAAQPISVPMGSAFNFEHDKPMNISNENISINFRCFGYCYNDDIIVHEFNKTVGVFNEHMRDSYRNSNMVKIPSEALSIFNGKGYPRINQTTYELEWYVDQGLYSQLVGNYERHTGAVKSTGGANNEQTLDYSFPVPNIPEFELPSIPSVDDITNALSNPLSGFGEDDTSFI